VLHPLRIQIWYLVLPLHLIHNLLLPRQQQIHNLLEIFKYITAPATRWFLIIGCPDTTHIWQVGDSPACNGMLRREGNKQKKVIIEHRTRYNLGRNIKACDILPLINVAWKNTFSDLHAMKQAIAERGFNPLNHALLLDKGLRMTAINATTGVNEADERLAELGWEKPQSIVYDINATDHSFNQQSLQQSMIFTSPPRHLFAHIWNGHHHHFAGTPAQVHPPVCNLGLSTRFLMPRQQQQAPNDTGSLLMAQGRSQSAVEEEKVVKEL